jgi:DHA1 family tetracycline resistance protein-like MFS transporter
MEIGLSFAFIGAIGGLVRFFAVVPTVRRMGERQAMIIGVVLFVGAQLLFGLAVNAALILVGQVLLCFGGLSTPAYNAAMSRRVDADRQGELQGAMGALQGFAGLIGPLVFSGSFACVAWAGDRSPWIGAPFLMGAIRGLGALVLTLKALGGRDALNARGAVALAGAPDGE